MLRHPGDTSADSPSSQATSHAAHSSDPLHAAQSPVVRPTAPPADDSATLPAATAPHTPLLAWLRTLLIGAVLLPAAAFVIVAWWGFERGQEEAAEAASRASRLGFEHAANTLAIAAEIGRRAAKLADLPDAELHAGEAAVRQRLGDLLTGVPVIVNLNVWGADGHALVASDGPINPTVNVGDRAYFEALRDPAAGFGLSEVLSGRQTGKELMNLTLRRPSPDGSFRGVVAVSLSPDFFRDYYRSLSAEDRRVASFALYRTDGELLARWPPPPDGVRHVQPSNTTLQRIAAGASAGTYVVPAQRGRETRIVSFRRLEGYPAYVVVGLSRAATLATWMRFLALLAAIIVPVTLGLVWVTWIALAKTRQAQSTALKLRDEMRLRAAAERAILESQKLETLAVLTGGVAHDFNNLLAIADTSLHIHLRKHPDQADEPQIRAMSRTFKSGVRLTRQLLSFSRKQALRPETVALERWLPSATELVRSSLAGKSITAEVDIAPGTAPIAVDLAEFELALINLALNAQLASPKGGVFRIVARNTVPADVVEGGRAMVVVRAEDRGAGIPADIMPRVIEPFFTTRERGAGSGLGLSQVHGFCSQSGGFLRIESEPGQGTVVSMFFPAVPVAAPAVTRQSVDGDQAATGHARGLVLLVEDNADLALTTEGMLVDAGFEVALASHAQAALDYLDSPAPRPDVVLSDIAMPGALDGIGLAFRLRRDLPHLPIILTTGYADQLDLAVGGGFEVLHKPTPPAELLARLRAAVPKVREAAGASAQR